jgi:hypothetical protein
MLSIFQRCLLCLVGAVQGASAASFLPSHDREW